MKIGDLYGEPRWLCWRMADATKIPVSAFGGPGSSTDHRTWSTYHDCVSQAEICGHDGVGLVITNNDDIVGIDMDDCIKDGVMTGAAKRITQSMDSYTEISPSGNGVKILVRCDDLMPSGFRSEVDGQCVEVYPHGRFFTFTGQGDLDKEIRCISKNDIEALRDKTCRSEKINVGDSLVDMARAYISKVEPAIAGSGGHNATFRVAHKLVIDFGLDQESALRLMREWNQGCEPHWSDKELRHKIASAVQRGDYSRFRSAVSSDQSEPDLEMAAAVAAKLDTHPIPRSLLSLPGIMGAFAEWVTSQNHRKNEVISMVAAVAMQSLMTSRKLMDQSGTRTNLYMVGLAPSSGGKQAALDCIRAAIDLTSSPSRVAGKVTSDAAMAQQLSKNPATLFLMDEFGLFLQKTQRAGPMASVQEAMLDLWGATKTAWRAKTYADGEKDRVIVQPCMSILGMTTHVHFWQGLTKIHMRDGFAGRLLVVDTGPRADRGTVIASQVPRHIIEGCSYLDRMSLGGNLADAGVGTPSPVMVGTTEAAETIYDEFIEECDSFTGDVEASIWGRAVEKSRKLGLIYASATGMIVDAEAASWGVEFARWSTKAFLARADVNVSGGSDRQGEISREVLAASSDTGSCTHSELIRKTGATVRTLDEAIVTLEAAGRVVSKSVKRGKRIFLKGLS